MNPIPRLRLPATLTMLVVCAGSTVTLPLAAQDEPIASFYIQGRKHHVTRQEASLFLVRRTRNSDSTKSAVQHLVDTQLIRRAANRAKLMPSTSAIDAAVRQYEIRLKAEKRDLDKFLAARRMSRSMFADKLALGMAQQNLAAKALRMAPERVTPKHISLWTEQARNKTKIVTDPKALPTGVVAKVGARDITTLELGEVLFMKANRKSLEGLVQEIVFMRITEVEALAAGIKLSKEDFERQFLKTKRRFENSARSHGLSYEDWLVAMGGSKQKELDSPTMRSILQHEALIKRKYSATVLDDMWAKRGAELMRRHGARRNLSILFVRASDKKGNIVKRSFKKARSDVDLYRRMLTKKNETFANLAMAESDDAASKTRGGRIGWQHAEYEKNSRSQRAPSEVLEAAFAMKIGEISAPIKTRNGYYLVWLSGIEPQPERATLHRRLLGELSAEYSRELVKAAKVQMLIK